jgi:hypothetical protein
MWPSWLTACYRLTPYLQQFGVNSALLDLGPCSDAEAVAVVQALIARLAHQQITLRAAIAPSGILAQLALFRLLQTPVSAHEPLTILTPEQIADLLRSLPIAALARLQFADQATTTTRTLTQAVSWLEDYRPWGRLPATTAHGVGFVVLEDETGRLPLAMAPGLAADLRRILRDARYLVAVGRLERVRWYRSLWAFQFIGVSENTVSHTT